MYNSDMLGEMNGKYNEKFEIVSSDVNEIGSGTYILSPKNNKEIKFNASKRGSYTKDDYRETIIKYYTEKYVKENNITNIKIAESKINDPLYHKTDFLQYDFWFEIQSYNDIENIVRTLYNIESYICQNVPSKDMFTLGGKIRSNNYISKVQYNGHSQLDSLLYQEQYSYINYFKENNISTQDISNDELQRIWKPEKLKIIINNKELENSDKRKLMDNSFAVFNLELKDYDLYLPHLVEYVESIEKLEDNIIKYNGKTYKIEGNNYTDKNISYQCSIMKLQEILKERCGARANGRRIGNVGRKFAFSSRIRCGFCGNCFTRRTVVGKDREKIPSWSCISFAKNGKENCTDSKTIREEMIKEAFVDSYKLLSSNTNFETEEFLNLMHDTMNENNRQDELEKLKKEFVDIKSKKSKLIDLMVEDKISENDYNEKVEKYNRKLEILENKIEQLKLLAEDKKSISDGLKKVRELLDSKDIMEDFDQEIFNAIVDYVIVGGYDENGVMDPYLIRFILKREFDLSVPKDVPDEVVIQNNKIDLNSNNVLVDFINTRKYFSYERDESGKLNKVLRNGLRIRVECDIT